MAHLHCAGLGRWRGPNKKCKTVLSPSFTFEEACNNKGLSKIAPPALTVKDNLEPLVSSPLFDFGITSSGPFSNVFSSK